MYDVIIIGAGPAGMAAAVTASSHKLKTLVVAKLAVPFEGILESTIVHFEDLQKKFTVASKFLEFFEKETVTSVEKNIVSFSVEALSGKILYARAVIVCSGAISEEGNTQFDHLSRKDAKGKIKVDANMQTGVSGLYAAGAVTSTMVGSLAEPAVFQGGVAASSALVFLKTAG